MLHHLLPLISLFSYISCHGIITSPPVRAPGPASLTACGLKITSILERDNQTGLEALYAASSIDPAFDPAECSLILCKGLRLEDNLRNVQTYKPGEVVEVKVWTRIPHIGWASMAVMDTRTTPVPLIIGEQLITFETDSVSGLSTEDQERTAVAPPVDMEFNVTIPQSLGGRCTEPGNCVLQWTWLGRVAHQTYESCIDFVMEEDETDGNQEDLWQHDGHQELLLR